MAEIYGLSAADIGVLREIAKWWRASPRRRGDTFDPGEEIGQAPEIYVARTPTTGIPAMTEAAGTSIDDQPGYADCTIYRTIPVSDVPTLKALGIERRIHNLGAEIGGEVWIFVMRDKFGVWWVMEGETEEVDLVESVCLISSASAAETGTGLDTGTASLGTGGPPIP